MRLAAIPDMGMGKPPEAMGAEEFYSFQTVTTFIDGKGDWYYSTKDEACQLERQDQLQEMVGDYQAVKDYIFGIGSNLDEQSYLFREPFTPEYIKSFASMEQLWLAFVMKEKYNKVWDGEKWKATR